MLVNFSQQKLIQNSRVEAKSLMSRLAISPDADLSPMGEDFVAQSLFYRFGWPRGPTSYPLSRAGSHIYPLMRGYVGQIELNLAPPLTSRRPVVPNRLPK